MTTKESQHQTWKVLWLGSWKPRSSQELFGGFSFPAAVLVFLVVPGDSESGAFYVYDRRSGTWFWVDFEDNKFGGYNESDFERLVRQSQFLRLVERPWLLECEGKWFVQPGDRLRCRFDYA